MKYKGGNEHFAVHSGRSELLCKRQHRVVFPYLGWAAASIGRGNTKLDT